MAKIRVRVPSSGEVSQQLQRALAEIDGNVSQVTAKVRAVSGVSWHPGDGTEITEWLAQSRAAADRVNSSLVSLSERLQHLEAEPHPGSQ